MKGKLPREKTRLGKITAGGRKQEKRTGSRKKERGPQVGAKPYLVALRKVFEKASFYV